MDIAGNRPRSGLLCAVRDFAVALALFWALALSFDVLQAPAHAWELPDVQAGTYAAAARNPLQQLNSLHISAKPTLVMLSLVVALLAAANLAFFRHLRLAYAKPASRREQANE